MNILTRIENRALLSSDGAAGGSSEFSESSGDFHQRTLFPEDCRHSFPPISEEKLAQFQNYIATFEELSKNCQSQFPNVPSSVQEILEDGTNCISALTELEKSGCTFETLWGIAVSLSGTYELPPFEVTIPLETTSQIDSVVTAPLQNMLRAFLEEKREDVKNRVASTFQPVFDICDHIYASNQFLFFEGRQLACEELSSVIAPLEELVPALSRTIYMDEAKLSLAANSVKATLSMLNQNLVEYGELLQDTLTSVTQRMVEHSSSSKPQSEPAEKDLPDFNDTTRATTEFVRLDESGTRAKNILLEAQGHLLSGNSSSLADSADRILSLSPDSVASALEELNASEQADDLLLEFITTLYTEEELPNSANPESAEESSQTTELSETHTGMQELLIETYGEEAVDIVTKLLAETLGEPSLATELIDANPDLFSLYQEGEDHEGFIQYLNALQDALPFIAEEIQNETFKANDFSSPTAIENYYSKMVQDDSALEEKKGEVTRFQLTLAVDYQVEKQVAPDAESVPEEELDEYLSKIKQMSHFLDRCHSVCHGLQWSENVRTLLGAIISKYPNVLLTQAEFVPALFLPALVKLSFQNNVDFIERLNKGELTALWNARSPEKIQQEVRKLQSILTNDTENLEELNPFDQRVVEFFKRESRFFEKNGIPLEEVWDLLSLYDKSFGGPHAKISKVNGARNLKACTRRRGESLSDAIIKNRLKSAMVLGKRFDLLAESGSHILKAKVGQMREPFKQFLFGEGA